MILFYLIACISSIAGMILWITTKKVVWWEWLISTALSFLICGFVHIAVIQGMTADMETWSGEIVKAVYHPRWVEEYQQMHTRTVGSGKNQRTEIYYTTEHRTHHRKWIAHIDYGKKKDQKNITESFYNDIKIKWGGDKCQKVVKGNRLGFYSGDRNDYVLTRMTDYIYPAVTTYTFENRVKAAPSVFSYSKVPEDAKVYKYPTHSNWRQSSRLLGIAGGPIPILDWDRMNSRLGPVKKVNVIMIGFGVEDAGTAHMQEAKWIGGKKNDLVLCYGGTNDKVDWSYVFGWTEQEIVKRNLETILLKNPINVKLIDKIETEIIQNYKIKEWENFNYISVEPPMWTYFMLIGILVATQGGFLAWSYFNSQTKDTNKNRYGF